VDANALFDRENLQNRRRPHKGLPQAGKVAAREVVKCAMQWIPRGELVLSEVTEVKDEPLTQLIVPHRHSSDQQATDQANQDKKTEQAHLILLFFWFVFSSLTDVSVKGDIFKLTELPRVLWRGSQEPMALALIAAYICRIEARYEANPKVTSPWTHPARMRLDQFSHQL
jgi:hypothetical protein